VSRLLGRENIRGSPVHFKALNNDMWAAFGASWRWLRVGLLPGLLLATPAAASVVSFSGTLPTCQTSEGATTDCTDTLYYSTDLASATSGFIGGDIAGGNPALASFTTAFNDWNSANGGLWTLVNGGALPLNFSLSLNGVIGSDGGGISSVIATLSDYQPTGTEPSLSQLVWTQALFTDYTPTAGLVATPEITLDTYSLSESSGGSDGAFENACVAIPGQSPGPDNTTPSVIGATPSSYAYCDPIYPFQYSYEYNGDTLDGVTLSSDFFFDGPEGPWPDTQFRAVTLLSTVTFDTNGSGAITGRVLTVYDGFEYGFSLSVPEVGSGWLFAPMLPVLALMRRGRRARRAG
jgi:hypothetical protein